MLFLFSLGFGLGAVFQKAGQGRYFDFLVPGIISQSILFTAFFSGAEIIWDRQFGFLKETLIAPVSRLEIMIGRTLGGATVATFQGTIVLLVSLLAGFKLPNLFCLPAAFLVMFLIAILFAGIGTAIASTLEDAQGFQLIINFLVMPLFFLSGALFPLDSLPEVLSLITKIDPLSYGVDGLRAALAQPSHFGLGIDLLVLSLISAFFLVLGSKLFSKIEI